MSGFQGYTSQNDQKFTGTTRFQGRVAGDGGGAPADGLVHAARQFGFEAMRVTPPFRMPVDYQGGVVLLDKGAGSGDAFEFGLPGVMGRRILIILNEDFTGANLDCNIMTVLDSRAGYTAAQRNTIYGTIITGDAGASTKFLSANRGWTLATSATPSQQPKRGDMFELFDSGSAWYVRGTTYANTDAAITPF